MKAVIFDTPGLLDIRAITTFGVNAKPNSESPIGFFGTGLKYAIAICLREKCPISVYIGKTRYRFSVIEDTFRDKEFGFIQMEWNTRGLIPRHKTLEMPFTTELGKTWKLWQAFRELYSNTLDEQGLVHYDPELDIVDLHRNLSEDRTLITVYGEEFTTEYMDKDKTFHPQASRNRTGNAVEHFFEGSNHVYYRGMRVQDLEKPSRLTYNILSQIELTEDRTVKHTYQTESAIRDYIVGSSDVELQRAVLKAPEGSYESRFNFNNTYRVPSSTFTSTARSVGSSNSTVKSYLETYDPQTRQETGPTIPEQFYELLHNEDWNKLTDFCQEHKTEILDLVASDKFTTAAF